MVRNICVLSRGRNFGVELRRRYVVISQEFMFARLRDGGMVSHCVFGSHRISPSNWLLLPAWLPGLNSIYFDFTAGRQGLCRSLIFQVCCKFSLSNHSRCVNEQMSPPPSVAESLGKHHRTVEKFCARRRLDTRSLLVNVEWSEYAPKEFAEHNRNTTNP